MRRSSTAWIRGIAALLTLMVALTFSAPPCDAADASTGAAPKTSERRALAASADAHVAALAPPPRALAQDASTGATDTSGSFFRSRKGVAAIVLMVAGASFVAYKIPKDNGKVHSPIR